MYCTYKMLSSSRGPALYKISPNPKLPVIYRNIKCVEFTNSHAAHVNYHMLDR